MVVRRHIWPVRPVIHGVHLCRRPARKRRKVNNFDTHLHHLTCYQLSQWVSLSPRRRSDPCLRGEERVHGPTASLAVMSTQLPARGEKIGRSVLCCYPWAFIIRGSCAHPQIEGRGRRGEEAGGSGDARDHLIQSLPHQQVPPGLDWRRRRRLRDIHGQPSRDRGRRFETRTPSPARQNGHSASDTRLHRTHHTPALQHRASRQIIIGKRGGFHVVLHLRHHRD